MQVNDSAERNSKLAADTLLELHQTSRIAAEYPMVSKLLTGMQQSDLLRAGNFLASLGPDAVLREHPEVPTVRVAITGHGTVSTLVPPLTAELGRHGLLLRPYVADFDSYVPDLLDPDSGVYAFEPAVVLCVLDPAMIFDEVPSPWRVTDVERVATEKLKLLGGLAAALENNSTAMLVLNTLPLPRRYAAQLVDHRSRARLGAIWREVNAGLLRLADTYSAVVALDLDPILAEGIPASDTRQSIYVKAHLSSALLARYAREVGHLVRHLTGRTRKCLVMDLDDTLWGGILGEDGLDGIRVGIDASYQGAAFHSFQQAVKQIGSQGVLLAVVSKNDPEPVRTALAEHPGMVLRDNDFVRVIANWRPKHDNLTDLATSLNLGLDAFVFADDSVSECGLIRQKLGDVAVVQLDIEPALHIEKLLADGWFDVRELTAEDRDRPGQYRAEVSRREFMHSFGSLDDYLRELEVKVRLAVMGDQEAARVSQLTLRTNQFNMTTERLQAVDVRTLAADPSVTVLTIHAADRFGDNGLVGALFLRRADRVVHIDNFLLSCRVFGRGIEQACLAAVLRHARDTGADAVIGTYRPTAKNGKISDLYLRHGFQSDPDDAGSAEAVFWHRLANVEPSPEYVRLVEKFGKDGQ